MNISNFKWSLTKLLNETADTILLFDLSFVAKLFGFKIRL